MSQRKKIFVIGSGRSGTHLVGNLLDSHAEIAATIEKPEIFHAVTRMALDPRTEPQLYPKVADLYVEEHGKVADLHYADKSHPNIWLAERLAESFEEAVFLGIQRDPRAVVASMLRHDGVQQWHRRWREFPVPNRFLGISADLEPTYDDLSLETQCALRWKAHAERMADLRNELGERMLYIDYERLLQDEQAVRDIEQFLELEQPFPPFEMQLGSLEKWEEQLSDEQVAAVTAVADSAMPHLAGADRPLG